MPRVKGVSLRLSIRFLDASEAISASYLFGLPGPGNVLAVVITAEAMFFIAG